MGSFSAEPTKLLIALLSLFFLSPSLHFPPLLPSSYMLFCVVSWGPVVDDDLGFSPGVV